MKLLSLMITGAALAWCQSAPETLFAHVDFVKPTQGKAADYHKALKESVMPKRKGYLAAPQLTVPRT